MRTITLFLLAFFCMPMAFALDAATIKIRINGAIHDNRYFLCLPEIGCLSLLAAKKGKIYPVLHPIQMNSLFINNIRTFHVSLAGQPASCNVNVNIGQSVIISGNLSVDAKDQVHVNQLRCAVKKGK